MEILGTFENIEGATKAVDRLVAAGLSEENITSITSVAYPDGVIVNARQSTWFRWLSVAGGFFGACAGFGLAAGTSYLYPVQTGDKPIIALFPTGIITYEVTMLFAILGTIVGMFIEMKLPPRRERAYDPAIGEGAIGISFSSINGYHLSLAEKVMQDAGALRITREDI